MVKNLIIKPEAIQESIDFFSSDADHQKDANKDLALILEYVRAEVEKKISPLIAYQNIKRVFPE